MTVAEIAKLLLRYTDQSLLAAANTLAEGHLPDIVSHINGGAQELYAEAPAYLNRRTRGALLPAPTSIAIASATQYSSTAGAITTHAAWMTGCTIRIAGQPDNRLLAYADGVSTFLYPLPESGTIAATVYGDSFELAADVVTVMPRPKIPGCGYLRPAQSESDLNRGSVDSSDMDYGRPGHALGTVFAGPAEPTTYWIEGLNVVGAAQPRLYFRVQPLPDRIYYVGYEVKIGPPDVALSDLDAENEGAECTLSIPVPEKWTELYLLPIIRQRFTGSPFFSNANSKDEIGRQYTAAIKALRNIRPQGDRFTRLIPGP